jgi:hypothetical protein
MRVADVRCIYDPGCHCAFTDIIRWRDRLYVAFREGINHSVQHSGQIVVLSSADLGRSFQPHARLANDHDLRDPHFYAAPDRLFLAIPSWIVPDPDRGVPQRVRTSHIGHSDNGVEWTVRKLEEPAGRTLWRPRPGPDGAWYAAAYAPARESDDYGVMLYRSSDGIEWERVSDIHMEDKSNETELCFLPDGDLLALVRREEEPRFPLLARSSPPYATWKKTGCDQFLQGPLLERLPDGTLLVVGRSPEPIDRATPIGPSCVTRGFELNIDTGKLTYLFTLPSGGDTSYAGLCHLGDGEALVSYYSGHGYANGTFRDGDNLQRCAIYLARLEL